VVEREARIYRRLWRGNFFSSFLGPFLYLGAMGLGLGGLVSAAGRNVEGLPYLEFVAPGLLAATVMQNAAAESLWPVMGGLRWSRHFHAMVAAPLAAGDVYVGYLVWQALRLTLNAVVFLIVASLLGAVTSPLGVLAVPFAVLTGVAIAAPLMAFSATQDEESSFPLVLRLGIMPLFLFSGTFFAVEQLPAAVQPLVWLSPLWHGIELCRAATTGRLADLGPVLVAVHLAALAALVVAGTTVGVRIFRRKLTT
jgi:lipooligosaccharide transport system permease protein